MAIDRRAAKAALLARTQESANKVEDSGRFLSYLSSELPLKSFRAHGGNEGNIISLLPFVVGNHYPSRTYPNLRPGDLTYVLDVFTHSKVGVNDDTYVCINRNYGQRCPICDHAQEVRDQIPDEIFDQQNPESDPQYGHLVKLFNALKAKRRCVYNVLDWTNENNPDAMTTGVRYWEVSHYLFERNLIAAAKLPRGGGYVNFSDLDEGKDIFFLMEGKGKSTKYVGIRFEDRPEPISIEHEEQAVSLDNYLIIPTFAQLYEAHYGEAYEEGAPTPAETAPAQAPATTGRRRAPASNPPPPVEEEDIPSETPAATTPPPAATGRRRGGTPAATTTPAAQPAAQPAGRRGRSGTASAAQPATTTVRPTAVPAGTCPAGHIFGGDVDRFEADCTDCAVWDDCARANSEQTVTTTVTVATSTPAAQPAVTSAARRPRRGA